MHPAGRLLRARGGRRHARHKARLVCRHEVQDKSRMLAARPLGHGMPFDPHGASHIHDDAGFAGRKQAVAVRAQKASAALTGIDRQPELDVRQIDHDPVRVAEGKHVIGNGRRQGQREPRKPVIPHSFAVGCNYILIAGICRRAASRRLGSAGLIRLLAPSLLDLCLGGRFSWRLPDFACRLRL